jgi:hypothetical protein
LKRLVRLLCVKLITFSIFLLRDLFLALVSSFFSLDKSASILSKTQFLYSSKEESILSKNCPLRI